MTETISLDESSNQSFNQVSKYLYGIITYSTERSAAIQSLKVGAVYRIAQLLILSYIIGWELLHNKGYQNFDSVSSAVTTKVKGQGFVPINATIDNNLNKSDPNYFKKLFLLDKNVKYHMLDTADYVIPPNEYNSIFIMTNYIRTEQKQSKCGEEDAKHISTCSTDDDCMKKSLYLSSWNGIPTGRCIDSTSIINLKVCEIVSWCPLENEPERINDILSEAENDENEKYRMMIKGSVILIDIVWNCDFDFRGRCLPEYSFRRFDTKETNSATGFNFRYANKFKEDNIEYRVLYKAYGLRFIINVSGIAGKFNIVPLMLKIGSGIGLMSLSVIFADCVLLHCTKKKKFYQEIKEIDLKQVERERLSVVRL